MHTGTENVLSPRVQQAQRDDFAEQMTQAVAKSMAEKQERERKETEEAEAAALHARHVKNKMADLIHKKEARRAAAVVFGRPARHPAPGRGDGRPPTRVPSAAQDGSPPRTWGIRRVPSQDVVELRFTPRTWGIPQQRPGLLPPVRSGTGSEEAAAALEEAGGDVGEGRRDPPLHSAR